MPNSGIKTPYTFHSSASPSAPNPSCQGPTWYFNPNLRRITYTACPIPRPARLCLTILHPSSLQIISSTLRPHPLLLLFGTCLLGVECCIAVFGSSVISGAAGIEALFVLGVSSGVTESCSLMEWTDSRSRVDIVKVEG